MKSKEQRYKEAVARNIGSAKHYRRQEYEGAIIELGLLAVKHRLGVRKNDFTHDDEILSAFIGEDV